MSAKTAIAPRGWPSPPAAALLAAAVLAIGWSATSPIVHSTRFALGLPRSHGVAARSLPTGVRTSIGRIDALIADGTIRVTARGLVVARPSDRPAPGLSAATLPAEDLAGQARDARFATARAAIDTVERAQRELNGRMGTHLPVTGYFDGAWRRAVASWAGTRG